MITFPAFVSQVRTMADGSLRVTFDTQELSPVKMASLFEAQKSIGIVAFIPESDGLSNEEQKYLKEMESQLTVSGSPSQIMRNALYGKWKRDFEGQKKVQDFESWYRDKIFEWVEKIKKL